MIHLSVVERGDILAAIFRGSSICFVSGRSYQLGNHAGLTAGARPVLPLAVSIIYGTLTRVMRVHQGDEGDSAEKVTGVAPPR